MVSGSATLKLAQENRLRVISPAAWLAIAVLSVAMVALNHSFDVVGGRFEETVTSGAQLHLQEQSETQVTGGTLMRKLGLACLLLTGGIALIGRPEGVQLRLSVLAAATSLLLGWVALSLVWSTDATKTLHELIRLSAYVVTSILLVRRFCVHELIWMFLIVCLVAIAADVAADIAAGTFRPWESDFRMGGALHPNHVGRLGSIVAMIGLAATWERRFRNWGWALLVAGCVVVFLSVSRSALAGLAAGIVAVMFLGTPGRRLGMYAAVGATVFALFIGAYAVSPPSLQRNVTGAALMGRTEDASSLTGRWPLWVEMWRDSANRRLQGFGYGAYWTVDRNYELGSVIEWYPTHSHSIYMELLIDLGFVGLLLCLVVTVLSIGHYSQLVAATGRFEYRVLGALFICAIANGFFEVGFVWPRFEGMFLGMAVLVLLMKAEAQPRAATSTVADFRLGEPRLTTTWRPPSSSALERSRGI